MTLTEINTNTQNEKEKQDLEIISTLINECSEEYTKEGEIHFITFQEYFEKQVCDIEKFKDKDCELTITKLKCGSLITYSTLVLGVEGSDPDGISKGKAGDVIENEIEVGKLGAFTVNKTSFNSTDNGEIDQPTTAPQQPYVPSVYVIVTMEYTWHEFCKVEEIFREKIAKRSYDIKGNKLQPSDIYIVNNEKCDGPDKTKEGIDVWIVALGEDQDEVTKKIGYDLMDLLDSRQLRKLGNHFENRASIVFA